MNDGAPNGNGWRELARFQIARSEEQIRKLEARLQDSEHGIVGIRVEQADMKGQLGELRTDIAKATAQLEEGRRNDLASLQQSIKSAQQKSSQVLLYLIFPVVVLVVGGLLVYALTGGH